MNFKFILTILLLLISLVVFDAFQQKYYIETFQLSSEVISIYTLIQTHWIRWMLWILTTIPMGWLAYKQLRKSPKHVNSKSLSLLFFGSLISVILALALISIQSIYAQSLEFAPDLFLEFYLFFIFQKGLILLFANGLLILLIHRALTAALRVVSFQEPPQLEIRVGTKIKTVELEEIVWIQADDYCAKIHTADDKSFTIRKSLKTLEKELSPFRFVRVHRGALLNLNYLDLINTQTSTIRLSNSNEISASKSDLRSLRERVAM